MNLARFLALTLAALVAVLVEPYIGHPDACRSGQWSVAKVFNCLPNHRSFGSEQLVAKQERPRGWAS